MNQPVLFVRSLATAVASFVCSQLAMGLAVLLLIGTYQTALAQKPVVRELFVPFEDLNVLLESSPQRIFLTRKEYEELLATVKPNATIPAPRQAVVVAAAYEGEVAEGRLTARGTLTIDVLADGVHPLLLELAHVGLRRATLDGKEAPIGLNEHRQPILFVTGEGRKKLELEFVAPLETSAALQSWQFEIPTPATTTMRLTVPGNVEVKSGAEVLKRDVDAAANVTRFSLLPRRGVNTLVMTLNNRQLLQQRALVARSVIVDEVTQAYERLHATVSFGVLHGAVDRLRLAVPSGFEVTDVATPLLSRWVVTKNDDPAKPAADGANGASGILDITLREPTTEQVAINISAIRTPAPTDMWRFPQLTALDVEGQVSVIGLLSETRLKVSGVTPTGLVSLDNSVLSQNLPATIFQAEPGAPQLRPIVAYFAPQAQYDLQAKFSQPPGKLQVTTNLLLTLDEQKQQARGAFTLRPEVEKLFGVEFATPAGWHVDQVTNAQGQPLVFEVYALESGGRVNVRLPVGAEPDSETVVNFKATSTPDKWLGGWTKASAALPDFAILGAVRDEGAVAVQALDDLHVRPDKLEQLVPLDENEKSQFGLEGVPTDLVYRYEGRPFSATFAVERRAPVVTARSFSFFKIESENLLASYEVAFDIEQARTDRLILTLPKTTPVALSIRGLDGVGVKEFNDEVVDGRRRWTVSLTEKRRGRVRLAVDFQQPRSNESGAAADEALPLIRAEGTTYQSGLVAVEGNAELDITVTTTGGGSPRKADVGELAEADYEVGRRLLAAYGFVGELPTVTAQVVRRPGYELPAAIVQRAELITVCGRNGASATAVRFQLRTKALMLEVRLPDGAKLWAAHLDGTPLSPQRDQQQLLLNLPAANAETLHDLQLVYEAATPTLSFGGTLSAEAPRLLIRDDASTTSVEVPLADVRWYLRLPSGYRLVRSGGSVTPDLNDYNTLAQLGPRTSPWTRLAGGVSTALSSSPLVVSPKSAQQSDVAYLAEDAPAQFRYTVPSVSDESMPLPAAEPMAPRAELTEEKAKDLQRLEDRQDRLFAADSVLKAPQEADASTALGTLKGSGIKANSEPVSGKPADGRALGNRNLNGTALSDRETADFNSESTVNGRVNVALWALEGLRSLPFDFAPHLSGGADVMAFESLGVAPMLSATVIDQRRLAALAWGVAGAVLLGGLLLMWKRPATKVKFLFTVLLLATVLPLIAPWDQALATVGDFAFFAAWWVVLFYLVVAVVCYLISRVPKWFRSAAPKTSPAVTATLLMCVLSLASTTSVVAQDAPPPTTDVTSLATKLLNAIQSPPVKLPADAIVVPYNPDDPEGVAKAEKVLIPFEKYQELWNLAHPQQKLGAAPPVPFVVAGARYEATLRDGDALQLVGRIEIDVLTDDAQDIPFALGGGVFSDARLDGQTARMRVVQAAPPAQPPVPQQQAAAANGPPANVPPTLVTVSVAGRGRKQFTFNVQLHLEKRGGWRIVEGQLPTAAATSLTLIVPDARTEVRFNGVPDRSRFETAAANEQIETALAAGQSFAMQWRPKVAEADVDKSLTANSTIDFDVRDDSLRLVWHVELDFPRSRREGFTLFAPADYLVERVYGGNVRGWQAAVDGERQKIDVTLLKGAADHETLKLHLSRRGRVGAGPLAKFSIPVVSVGDAALQQGVVTLLRSPLLELQVNGLKGLTRTDVPATTGKLETEQPEQSVLVSRPFQSFRFQSDRFAGGIEATEIPVTAKASLQSILRITDRETRIETQVRLRAPERAMHQVQLRVPLQLVVERVSAPEISDWSITPEANSQLLTLHLASGQVGDFSVFLVGTLGPRKPVDPVSLPVLEVLHVSEQAGDFVVQVDPAIDVRAEKLRGCEAVLLSNTYTWLKDDQRGTARLALHYRNTDYDGTLVLSQRQPRVSAYSVTNIRVTMRAIEETISLHFNIQDAGIRELSFQVPAWLQHARVKTRLLRQSTVEPGRRGADGDASGGWVRFKLEFQDEIMGPLQVVLENDRLFTADTQQVPVPQIETGKTDQRFVALESSGLGEVVFDKQERVTPLTRQQQPWRKLADLFGENILAAFLVQEGIEPPVLSYHMKERVKVETVGARIGLAETELQVDTNGAYRARQTYRVDNSIEQYLVIELPEGAQLWTALVAGEPVKPAPVPAGGSARGNIVQQVRIPLVKTAPGDADFPVVLTYAGKLPPLATWDSVNFPLMKTVNINVELSLVRLLLPPTHRWYNFGGKLGRVEDNAEFKASYYEYLTKQAEQLSQILRNNPDELTILRCESNLKQLGFAVQNFSAFNADLNSNEQFARSQSGNTAALHEAEKQLQSVAASQQQDSSAEVDNRERLNDLVEQQQGGRARNVVTKLGRNFTELPIQDSTKTPATKPQVSDNTVNLNGNFFLQNDLGGKVAEQPQRVWSALPSKKANLAMQGEGRGKADAKPQEQNEFFRKELDELRGRQSRGGELDGTNRDKDAKQSLNRRYQQRLEQQGGQQANQPGFVSGIETLNSANNAPRGGQAFEISGAGQPGLAPVTRNPVPNASVSMQGSTSFGVVPNSPSTLGGMGMGGGGSLSSGTSNAAGGGEQSDFAEAGQAGRGMAYLASLDIALPQRGTEFLFRTPRGDLELTASAVASSFTQRLTKLAMVVAALVGLFVLSRIVAILSKKFGNLASLQKTSAENQAVAAGK